MSQPQTLGFIGAGHMASALIGGLHAAVVNLRLYAHDAKPEALAALVQQYRITALAELDGVLDIVVLAVKPIDVEAAVTQSRRWIGPQTLVLSIAAGIPTSALARWLPKGAALVRAMPNTPALIGAGISALYASAATSAAQRALAEQVLGAAGETVWVHEEVQLDAVTAVSGSGPAYVFYFIEALEAAARAEGLPADISRRLALATFAGASALAMQSAHTPAELRAQVTSKGGTTAAALQSLDNDQVAYALARAVKAACERACALGATYGQADSTL